MFFCYFGILSDHGIISSSFSSVIFSYLIHLVSILYTHIHMALNLFDLAVSTILKHIFIMSVLHH